MSVIADALGVEGPSLVRTVDMLENEGLVSRRADPADKRARLLKLTVKGEGLVPGLMEAEARLQQRFLAGFPPMELEAMVRGLARLDQLMGNRAGEGNEAAFLPAEGAYAEI